MPAEAAIAFTHQKHILINCYSLKRVLTFRRLQQILQLTLLQKTRKRIQNTIKTIDIYNNLYLTEVSITTDTK